MNPADTIELDDRNLNTLIKALTSTAHGVNLGILGSKSENHRKEGELSNADIGAKHEFGDAETPIRSWLRMPLIEEFAKFLEQSGIFTEGALKEVIKAKSLDPWLAKFGIVGEEVVQEAFATGGFGKWKPSVMNNKKNHQTLVETQQLRNSVASEVK